MKRIETIKHELSLIGNDGTLYEVHITGDLKIEAGFIDTVLVYGRDMEDNLINLNTDFGSTNQIEKHYENGTSIRIVRKSIKN